MKKKKKTSLDLKEEYRTDCEVFFEYQKVLEFQVFLEVAEQE